MQLVSEKDYLAHHGIRGQKWGIRRYQNPDGSLTEAGRKRYTKLIAENHEEQRAMAARGHYNSINTKLEAAKKQIVESAKLTDSDEYKASREAEERLAKAADYGASDYEIAKLTAESEWADRAYLNKVGETFFKNSDSLYKAKLQDLGLPDNAEMIELARDYFYNRYMQGHPGRSREYDEGWALQVLH